jgi:hypothetical protein
MQNNTIAQASVGADLSRPSPIYRPPAAFPLSQSKKLTCIIRPLLIRQASFGTCKIASQPLWIGTNRSNEVGQTTTLLRVFA